MAGGSIVRMIYYGTNGVPWWRCVIVAEPDPSKAAALIGRSELVGFDEEVQAIGNISEDVIERLGLKPGEWTL